MSEEQDDVKEGDRVRAKSDSKVDSRSEIQKLFNSLKASSRDTTPGKDKPSPASSTDRGEKTPLFHPRPSGSAEGFPQLSQGLLREMGAGKQLLEFCAALPVFAALEKEGGSFLDVSGSGENTNAALTAVVGRWAVCVCVCVYMYVCVSALMYMYVCVSVFVCVCLRVPINNIATGYRPPILIFY